MDSRALCFALMILILLPLTQAVSLIKADVDDRERIWEDDTFLVSFIVRGDDKNNTVEIFMEGTDEDILEIDGQDKYSRTVQLGLYESRSVDVLLDGIAPGMVNVTYGFRTISSNGAAISIEQVLKDDFEVQVLPADDPDPEPSTTRPRSSGSGGGGGGGGGGVAPISPTEPTTTTDMVSEIPVEDVSIDSITGSEGAVNEMTVPQTLSPTSSISVVESSSSSSSGESTGSRKLLFLMGLFGAGTAIFGVALITQIRGAQK